MYRLCNRGRRGLRSYRRGIYLLISNGGLALTHRLNLTGQPTPVRVRNCHVCDQLANVAVNFDFILTNFPESLEEFQVSASSQDQQSLQSRESDGTDSMDLPPSRGSEEPLVGGPQPLPDTDGQARHLEPLIGPARMLGIQNLHTHEHVEPVEIATTSAASQVRKKFKRVNVAWGPRLMIDGRLSIIFEHCNAFRVVQLSIREG